MSLASLTARGLVGPLFIGHGAQKLFGAFDGPGLEETGKTFEQLGLRPGREHALAAGASEAGGGLLLTLGALTPLGASMICGAMVTAIRKVHAPNGPWIADQGWEYNAVLIATALAVVDRGPGRPSVDAARFPRLKGPGWAITALAAGIAGSYLADRVPELLGAGTEAEAAAETAAPPAPGDERADRFAREQATSPSR